MARLAPISDYVWFQEGPGVRNTQYTTSGVKLLNVANLVDGRVDLSTSDRYISTEEAYGRYKHFLVDPDDFIIASSGIQIDYFDQKMGFVSEDQLPLCMNTSTIRFKPIDEGELDMRYFMYYLKSNSFKQQLSKHIVGSAQLNFGPTHLKKMTFPVVDVEQQHYISMVLYKADELITLRKKQLQKLDNLVKSRFVEMFGGINLYCNMGYYIKALVAGKSLAGEEECENKVLKTGAASFDCFDATQVKNLPLEYVPQREHLVNVGDIIISRMNTAELTGAAAYVWDVPEKVYLPDRLWKAILQGDCNPIFVWQMLIQPSTKEQIRRECSGTSGSMKNISKPGMLAIKVKKVPFSMQNQFADYVKRVNKSKLTVQQGLDKLELLKQSLMQEYFG